LDHAPVVSQNTIDLKDLVHMRDFRLRLSIGRGASFGASCFFQMCPGQTFDGIQSVGRSEVRIPNRHSDILVAQELLQSPQINPGHNESAGKRMSETMPREISNFGRPDGGLKPVTRIGQRQAVRIQNDRVRTIPAFPQLQ